MKLTLKDKEAFRKYLAIPLEERRFKHRQSMIEQGNVKFKKVRVKKILEVKYEYLCNFIGNFGLILRSYYATTTRMNRWRIRRAIGRERLADIMFSKQIGDNNVYATINEIYTLCKVLDLRKDFLCYLISKTNLSYSILPDQKLDPIPDVKLAQSETEAVADKLGEFLFVILSEYILIHNLMFASGYKLKQIESIDSFLTEIN
ncbi:MAG TPA: hypothetical protein P5136_01040 [Methanofastidiosum sp.]|nr:hypothetical protein [Methanofastidiosum sp.]